MKGTLCKGNTVICCLYNTPEHKHYGDSWKATIVEVDHEHRTGTTLTPFCVTRFEPDNVRTIWLKRNEILRRL